MKLLFLFLFFLLTNGLAAQSKPSEPVFDSAEFQNRGAVVLEEDTLFFLYDKIHGITAKERAGLVNQRLGRILASENFAPDSFTVADEASYSRILYKEQLIASVTATDARWFGESPAQTAREYSQMISTHCQILRTGLDFKEIVKEILFALIILVVSFLIIRYVNRLFKFLSQKLAQLKGSRIKGVRIKSYELFDEDRTISLLSLALNGIRILLLLFLFYLTLPLVLGIFPWTQEIADKLIHFILDPLKEILKTIIAYLPNLFTIVIIFLVIRYLAKGIYYLGNEIRTEKLRLPGFYPDWGIPTARIINFVLYAFMVVLIWPYIPGSDSPIFKGVSVFLGLLISLGSSSAISNIISGLVITYMRPFKIGDRVRIGDVVGDVFEKNLLVTRVRTTKNEIITVPNSNILSSSSINFSISSERFEGLILHTSVTIGYDVPWRKVNEMLIKAALCTPLIEKNPMPFVLQTSLDDFYISYQVNAYTHHPGKQALIYSDLHALIQDIFTKSGVEIMSPHYRAHREGPDTTPPINGKEKDESTDS